MTPFHAGSAAADQRSVSRPGAILNATIDASASGTLFTRETLDASQNDLYRIDVESGAVTRLTDDPTAQEYPVEVSPDNAWLTVMTNKRHPARLDQPGQINVWKMRVDGSAYVPLTDYAFPAQGGGWSEDGAWISFITNENPTNLQNIDGYLMRPDGSNAHRVFHVKDGSQDVLGDWHPDSRHLAVTSDAWGTEHAGILHIESGEVRWLSDEGVQESAAGFSRDGRYLACLRNEEAQIRPVVYEVESGRRHDLRLPRASHSAASSSPVATGY
jgi:Tol biopolymer transport system component